MTDFWPEGYDNPAFRVRRSTFGVVRGGDYVRGSAQFFGTLAGAATPLPTVPAPQASHTGEMWLVGTPVPTAVPNPAGATKAAGNVIRWSGTAWVNIGSLVQATSTAVRNPTQTFDVAAAIGKGLLFCRPYAEGDPVVDYQTVEVMWGWPESINLLWEEVALVRSSYGSPSTPTQGQTIFRATRKSLGGENADGTNIVMANPPVVHDGGLPGGWWYYYTLFFRVTTDWVAYMSDGCLLPANYGHQGHLWDGVPPFYQWTDDNYRVDNGFLRQFLNVFGFYMDNVRGFVESALELHRTDKTPMSLLKHLGANYGVPYEAGLGDIRYRALVTNISNLHQTRGTAKCLEDLVETASKYQCDVVAGTNQMLLNDDSDFFTGTGNWVALHPSTNSGLTLVPWQEVTIVVNPSSVPTPAGAPGARGSMRVDTQQSVQTQNIMLAVGNGYVYDQANAVNIREVIPLYGGIPADTGETFGFSIWARSEKIGLNVTAYLMWFDATGQPVGLVSKLAGTPRVLNDASWYLAQVSGAAPAGAVYLVPALYLSNRPTAGATPGRSPWVDIAAAIIYSQQSDAPVTTVAPDRFLTLGDPAEKIGAAKAGFEGFILGSPQKST